MAPSSAVAYALVTRTGNARPGPGFEWMLSASATIRGYCRGARFVGHVEKRDRARQLLPEKRHPRVAARPGAGPVVELPPRPVEGARRQHVAHSLTGSFVTVGLGEVRARETAPDGGERRLVVGVDQFHAVAMREAVVGRVEIAPVVPLGLMRWSRTASRACCCRRAARSRAPRARRAPGASRRLPRSRSVPRYRPAARCRPT